MMCWARGMQALKHAFPVTLRHASAGKHTAPASREALWSACVEAKHACPLVAAM